MSRDRTRGGVVLCFGPQGRNRVGDSRDLRRGVGGASAHSNRSSVGEAYEDALTCASYVAAASRGDGIHGLPPEAVSSRETPHGEAAVAHDNGSTKNPSGRGER